MGWMSIRFRSGDRLQAPMPLAPARREATLSFFSDAKAGETQAWIGGYLWDGQSALQWYAMEVREDWAPWAFIKKDLKRTIASLELLGTLLCVKLWGARMRESGRGSGYLTGQPGELIRGFQADVHEVSPTAAAHGVVGNLEEGGAVLGSFLGPEGEESVGR